MFPWMLLLGATLQASLNPNAVADAGDAKTLTISEPDDAPQRQYMIDGPTTVVISGTAHHIVLKGAGPVTSLTVSGTGNDVKVMVLVQHVSLSGNNNGVAVAAAANPTDPVVEQSGNHNSYRIVGR